MMTDYNDGKWHGWNGGECPVHPESVVVGLERGGATPWKAKAKFCHWPSFFGSFSVFEAYREPRTVWAVGAHIRDTLEEAQQFCDLLEKNHPGQGYGDYGQITKFVEEIE